MNKIRKGDEVVVITGKDKGRRGTILQVLADDRVLVEGVLDISNVLVFNPKTKKGDRVGIKVLEDGSKERIFRSTGETVDI